MTRAKFRCDSVMKAVHWGKEGFAFTAKFSAVHAGSPENEAFFAATPAGDVSLTCYRDDLFVPGKCYYLDFTPAE